MIETVSSSETSVSMNQAARYYIAEDSQLHTRRHEKLKLNQAVNMFEYESKC